jgi:Protein of unknown function (DUF2808)
MFAIATILGASIVSIPKQQSNAVTLKDGTTYFLNPPRLVSSITSQAGTYIWGATYYFTLRIPDNAGEPLRKVVIEQEEGLGRPEFSARYTEAFEGDRTEIGKKVPLQQVMLDPNTRALTVLFDPPVSPGKTVTIRLYPVRNPNAAGTYLYGVTAFPVGEKPFGQFIGFGRIRIYDANVD